MLIKRPADIPASEITPESVYLDRRKFMKAAGVLGAGALLGCRPGDARQSDGGETDDEPAAQPPSREEITKYDDATGYNNYYEFGTDKEDPKANAGSLRTRPWSVAIQGAVSKPGSVPLETLLAPHPLEERIYRHRCVEAWSMVVPWVGFPLSDLLKRFDPAGDATFVEFESVYRPTEMPGQRVRFPKPILPWPYREGLRMDEAFHPLAIVAVGLYGETLPNQNGAPLRLVLPWKYGFKGIKSLAKISFVKKQPVTSWMEEARTYYGFYANVNPKVDHPMWSQARERRLGEFLQRPTLMFNGYAEDVSSMYNGMDLKRNF